MNSPESAILDDSDESHCLANRLAQKCARPGRKVKKIQLRWRAASSRRTFIDGCF
jgi:hypothetical protein